MMEEGFFELVEKIQLISVVEQFFHDFSDNTTWQ
jgi:hypothetical protein